MTDGSPRTLPRKPHHRRHHAMTPASVGGAHNPKVKPFSSISIGIIIMQPQHPSHEAKCETTILQHRRMSMASLSPAAWVCSDRPLEHGAVAEAEQHLQRYAIDVQPVRVKNRTRGAPRRCSAAREVGVGLEATRADLLMSVLSHGDEHVCGSRSRRPAGRSWPPPRSQRCSTTAATPLGGDDVVPIL